MNAAAALLVVGAPGSAGALTAQLRADRFVGRIVVVARTRTRHTTDRPLQGVPRRTHGLPEAPW
jgi:shikimate 5-dehydrogenase